jgi:hypothetical protein
MMLTFSRFALSLFTTDSAGTRAAVGLGYFAAGNLAHQIGGRHTEGSIGRVALIADVQEVAVVVQFRDHIENPS